MSWVNIDIQPYLSTSVAAELVVESQPAPYFILEPMLAVTLFLT
jgi:hypothetical protein